MLEVRTNFTPYKMKISRREPVALSVEVTNAGTESEIVSLELGLGRQFSLEKTGYKCEAIERIAEFKPSEKRKFYYDLWPKQIARQGEQEINLIVTEHYKDFNYTKRKYDRKLLLKVEE